MENKRDIVYKSIQGERYTPFSLAKKLSAVGILESASFEQGRARFSIIVIDEAFRIIQRKTNVFIKSEGIEKKYHQNDILDALSEIASQNKLSSISYPKEIPLPGAGIGYISYEYSAYCKGFELADQQDSLNLPDAEFIVGHIYVVFDHLNDSIHIFGLNYIEHSINLDIKIEQIITRLNDLDFSYLAPPQESKKSKIISNEQERSIAFKNAVREIQKEIQKGNLLQAVVSRRIEIQSEESALEIYRRLRSKSPSPYLFYLNFDAYQLVGASPESLVRVKDKIATIRPIAGTRSRGTTNEEDKNLSLELLADPKERAEHLMLVDLALNDLSTSCIPKTVHVSKNMEVEYFSHVMHIVSEVNGTLKNDKEGLQSSLDVIREAFPAGTVSGAPRIEAIKIISRLEKEKRSFYAGAVGYIQANGDFDFCISIRCALKKENTWYAQAGAGIVNESNPDREWEETNEKLKAFVSVIQGEQNDTTNR